MRQTGGTAGEGAAPENVGGGTLPTNTDDYVDIDLKTHIPVMMQLCSVLADSESCRHSEIIHAIHDFIQNHQCNSRESAALLFVTCFC